MLNIVPYHNWVDIKAYNDAEVNRSNFPLISPIFFFSFFFFGNEKIPYLFIDEKIMSKKL
jgi:hypothetical protein